jgi:hypothetical protein
MRPKRNPSTHSTPLKPEQIQYLVFEGGGGKGFAYLGAIEVLEKLRVFDNVLGYGGASAGAITALLLSLGMNCIDIEKYLLETDFNKFFDPASPRKMPSAGIGAVEVQDNEAEREFIDGNAVTKLLNQLVVMQLPWSRWIFPIAAVPNSTPLSELIRAATEKQLAKLPPPVPQLIKDWRKYLAYLPRDMGLFSGEAARREFDRLISARYAEKTKITSVGVKNITFAQHYAAFSTKGPDCNA